MKIRVISLMLSLLILAGCTNTKPSTPTPGTIDKSGSTEIMATVDGNDVPYGDFLTYIAFTEELARLIALENMAYSEMIRQDLSKEEAGFDKEAFDKIMEEDAGANLDAIMEYEDMQHIINLVTEKAGMTKEQYRDAALLDYEPGLLTDFIYQVIYERTEGDVDKYYEAMQEYSLSFDERTDFSNSNILVKLDGVEYPLTEEHKRYMEYTGLMARANAIHTIALNKYVYDQMVAEGMVVPTEGLEEHKAEIYELYTQDEVYQLLMPKALKNLGLTEEDYKNAMDPYLYLAYATSHIDEALNKKYEELPEEGKPATVEEYKAEYYKNLSLSLKIANIKP